MELQVSLVIAFLVHVVTGEALQSTNCKPPSYKCINGINCRRTEKPLVTIDLNYLSLENEHTSLESCRLVCGDTASLWPIPTGATSYGKTYVRIDPFQINFEMGDLLVSPKIFLSEVSTIFVSNLKSICRSPCERINSTTTIRIGVGSDGLKLDWDTDESYELDVATEGSNVLATIRAETVYGARHALETLSQLVARVLTKDGDWGLVILEKASIQDAPKFPHRGLLIDTARNFLPIADIIRTIDALGSTKMNVLHWHATDSQSFPLEIKSRPMSEYGAYSPEMIYTLKDLSYLARYAKLRGVRIIMEIDSPSHAGAGWEWGRLEGLEDMAVCVGREPWREYCVQPPCGQLNPVNPNTYKVLRQIYEEILDAIGPSSILHLGGDEVDVNCWNSTPEITNSMASKGQSLMEFLQLWGNFHKEQAKILKEIKGGTEDSIILWSSILTGPQIISQFLDKNRFVIQTWVESDSQLPEELSKLGYRIIVSTKNAWYLDHGFWGRTQYHSWREAYNNKMPPVSGVLGGEACMWGEYVNGNGLDSRVWPRGAAVAERLWSDPVNVKTSDAEPRLQSHKTRLESRRIFADPLTPEWCNQHDGMCT